MTKPRGEDVKGPPAQQLSGCFNPRVAGPATKLPTPLRFSPGPNMTTAAGARIAVQSRHRMSDPTQAVHPSFLRSTVKCTYAQQSAHTHSTSCIRCRNGKLHPVLARPQPSAPIQSLTHPTLGSPGAQRVLLMLLKVELAHPPAPTIAVPVGSPAQCGQQDHNKADKGRRPSACTPLRP